MRAQFLILLALIASSTVGGRSLEDPARESKPTRAEKYETSAVKLTKEAGNLERRIPKIPLEQRAAARLLLDAKRELAGMKLEAAALWRKHLGELPADFKPKLRESQSKHSAALKEYYRIGREIRASKQSSTSTNSIAPASVLGR